MPAQQKKNGEGQGPMRMKLFYGELEFWKHNKNWNQNVVKHAKNLIFKQH
jgi:hypothetical protein